MTDLAYVRTTNDTSDPVYWREKAEWLDYQLTVARQRGDAADVVAELERAVEDVRRIYISRIES